MFSDGDNVNASGTADDEVRRAQQLNDAAAMLGGNTPPDADVPLEPLNVAPQDDSRGVQGTGTPHPVPNPIQASHDATMPTNVPEPITDGSAAPPKTEQVDAFVSAMNSQSQQVRAEQQATASLTAIPEGAGYLTREQAKAAQDAKRNAGTELWLPETGTKALVRDLPFTDHTMLQGIPMELIRFIDQNVRDGRIKAGETEGTAEVAAPRSLEETLDMFGKAEMMANGVVLAAFIRPKLVQTEAELDPNDPNVWLVTDIALEDRIMVLNWCNRNRGLNAEGAATAVAGFPGSGVASPTDSPPSN
jgi:hypothetical protein